MHIGPSEFFLDFVVEALFGAGNMVQVPGRIAGFDDLPDEGKSCVASCQSSGDKARSPSSIELTEAMCLLTCV